jgi:hypothetical protein
VTCEELSVLIAADIDAIQSDIDSFEERAALASEHSDTSLTAITRCALVALAHPEEFRKARHILPSVDVQAVAIAWIRSNAPNVGLFRTERDA